MTPPLTFSFYKDQGIRDYQKFNENVYGPTDSRLFSLPELLTHHLRFTMRALKGIRKDDREKLIYNLAIAFSFLTAIANRLGVDLEEHAWQRFPFVCSYCAACPCNCKKTHPPTRVKTKPNESARPRAISEFQKMFEKIYPPSSRTLPEAGVHLAEEVGELNEAVYAFLGEHKDSQFEKIIDELADCTSCVFGVANSADINMAKELAEMFSDNCHICHKAPCVCTFSFISEFKS